MSYHDPDPEETGTYEINDPDPEDYEYESDDY